jgi:peptide/nickel transport system permease protein
LHGIEITFLLATTSVVIAAIGAVLIGMLAAYLRGIVDELIVRIADVIFSFPAILLALLVAAILGPGNPGAVVTIMLVTAPLMVRVVRATSMVVVERDFVVAAEVSGASPWRILVVHIFPNIASAAAVQATYALSVGMLIESSLSFLGLGVQPPDASLGSLVREGSVYITVDPWLVFTPGLLLAVAILSVNLLGDGLRDVLDPREAQFLR